MDLANVFTTPTPCHSSSHNPGQWHINQDHYTEDLSGLETFSQMKTLRYIHYFIVSYTVMSVDMGLLFFINLIFSAVVSIP